MEQEQQEIELKLLSAITKEDIDPVIDHYESYLKLYKKVRIPVFLMIATFAIYNLFFAGKSYSREDYDLIMNIVGIVGVIIVISLIVFIVLLLKRTGIMKKKIRELALKYNQPYKQLKKEINLAFKATMGGPGI